MRRSCWGLTVQREPVERPILFSGSMVTAILSGRKSQTRRVIKRPLKHPGWTSYVYYGPSENNPTCQSKAIECGPDYGDDASDQVKCPYGAVGDRLWVRESFFNLHRENKWPAALTFRADRPGLLELGGQRVVWTPGIHMPRWACRLVLEVTAVRVEHLRALTGRDAWAEGVLAGALSDMAAVQAYQELWDQINGKRAPWASDPWVWVVEFKRA